LSYITDPINVPLIVLRQYGLIGYIRLFKRENCIIEAKETGVKPLDLRLGSAWPELVNFANKFKFVDSKDKEDVDQMVHAPCIAMLI
jgi:hypothetical protein